MEFFATLDSRLNGEQLQQLITLERLPQLCATIDTLLSQTSAEAGEIYCLWGAFHIRRELINGGVRFTLPQCPNALAWTITAETLADRHQITIHCTINRRTPDPDFIESIEWFVQSWQTGLEALAAENPAAPGHD